MPKKMTKKVKEFEDVKMEEVLDGTVVYNVPFPRDLKDLDKLAPIIIKFPYHTDYIHSYGQDSPFFAGLTNKRLLGTECPKCKYRYGTPKGHCMYCGTKTKWFELPQTGRIHTWTTCYFGSEEFLPECPYNLILVEFDGVDTLFLARLIGAKEKDIKIGMKVKAKFKRLSKFRPTDVYFVPA